jgi:hypothetical protein
LLFEGLDEGCKEAAFTASEKWDRRRGCLLIQGGASFTQGRIEEKADNSKTAGD